MKIYPYRFKTEAEFINKFGENWMTNNGGIVDWVHNMDYLYGKDFPYNFNERELGYSSEIECYGGYWYVELNMLMKNEKIPNYEPRRIIY